MEKNIKILCIAAVMGCSTTSPSWAAEIKTEYKEEITPVQAELKTLESEMKPIREENKTSTARYKSVHLSKKGTGSLSASRETWKRAKELRSQITVIRENMGKSTDKDLRQQIKIAVKEKNFYTTIQSMDRLLELKKLRQDSINEVHQIRQQIDTLLQQD